MDVLLVQGQVILLVMSLLLLLEVLVEVKVEKKEFVVEEALLFSLSSTPTQTTHPTPRPAARCWAWGAQGSRLPDCAPCTRPALFWSLFLKQGAG